MSASLDGRRAGRPLTGRDSFVGRSDELAVIEALLTMSRLVTLTGPGGVGKSRLALRAAERADENGSGSVRFAELSSLRDPALVMSTVARAVQETDQAVRPEVDAPADRMGRERLLLVLDTCEHVPAECARVVERLLDAVPGLRVLATSRQPLAVPGEHVLTVPPLPVHPWGSGTGGAIELFVARAAAAAPGFTLTEDNRADVIAVCRRLDGIPLAVELAAVRLRSMSVAQLLARLDSRFEVLTSCVGLRPARHQTLRTAIGWSHELCTPLERLLWARLSAFDGGWDLEAAEFACSGGPLQAEEIQGVLADLVDKSIVAKSGHGTEARYRMLGTVRDYGAQWLEELGEAAAVRRRHRDYYRWLAKRGEAEWLGPRQVEWSRRMTVEHANLRIALEHCLTGRDRRVAVEMTGALWFLWYACGFQREGRRYLERALARRPEPGPELDRALWAHRLVTIGREDLEAAEDLSAVCARQAASRSSGSAPVPPALLLTGASLAVRGEWARSAALLGATGEPQRDGAGAEFFRLLTLAVRAYLLIAQGAYARAAAAADRLREECGRRGELWMRAWGEYFRGLAELGGGDPDAAARSGRAALEAKWRLRDGLGAAAAVDLVAAAAVAGGETDLAARLLGAGGRLWESTGLPQLGSREFTGFRRAAERSLRADLGDPAFETAYGAGRRLDPNESVALALDG